MASSSGTTSSNNMIEDHVTVFVAYDGKWEWDGKEWFFKESKGSMMVVSKYVTLSQITDILSTKFDVDLDSCGLKLEVYYRVGFPIIEIECDEDLSLFILESSKTKLLLCVTVVFKDDVAGRVKEDEIKLDIIEESTHGREDRFYERFLDQTHGREDDIAEGVEQDEINLEFPEKSPNGRKEHVTVFVAFDGKWKLDDKEWLFKDSMGSMMVVSKYVTLSQITDIICSRFDVDQDSYGLKLEVYYRVGFPIIEIKCDEDLSLFISKSLKTELVLCVTKVDSLKDINPDIIEEESLHDGKDYTIEKRLYKAIQRDDWVKAREIVNTKEVTWTSKIDDFGNTAFHLAVGEYQNNEVVREILMEINNELLVTAVNNFGCNPTHTASNFGNTKALKMMLDSGDTKCLFIPDDDGYLAIHHALTDPAIETFLYLFKQMKSYKVEYDMHFRGMGGLLLLHQVIDTELIDVAYELINDYPSLATTVNRDETALELIISKLELFYNGIHDYSFYSRFVYHIVPVENNNLGSTDMVDVENQEISKKDKFVTNHTRRCLHDVISRICVKLWETTLLHVPHVKHLKEEKVKHNTTVRLLRRICEEVDKTHTQSDIIRLYRYSICLAVEKNTAEVIEVLTTYFAELYYARTDGLYIYQLIVLNRSEKVYRYILHHQHLAKTFFSTSLDDDGNNILHLAGRLAPRHKLVAASGAALQMQRELQWFEELKRVVGIALTRALNDNKETPMMVFREAHKELRKDGEEWMKKTADSY